MGGEALRNMHGIGFVDRGEGVSHLRVFLNVHHSGDGDTEIRGWAPEICTKGTVQRLSTALANTI